PARPGAAGPRRRPPPGDAPRLLPPAHPHRDGQGTARAPVPRARRARRAAAARAGRAREPRPGRPGTPRRLPGAAQRRARRGVVALPPRRDRRHLAPGSDHETVGCRMKVLFLVTRFPVPPWRGDQLRAYHHLRLLAPRHEITCAALVDLVDALSASFARRAARERGPLGMIVAAEAARLLRYENELVRRGLTCLVVAESERAPLAGREAVRVVPNGVDLAAFAYVED